LLEEFTATQALNSLISIICNIAAHLGPPLSPIP
jgi:hypothetical protein